MKVFLQTGQSNCVEVSSSSDVVIVLAWLLNLPLLLAVVVVLLVVLAVVSGVVVAAGVLLAAGVVVAAGDVVAAEVVKSKLSSTLGFLWHTNM